MAGENRNTESGEEKTDLRIRRTRMLLKEAFRRLILEKSLEDISVSDIAREAPINRRTFYLHYSSVHELMMAIERDYAAQTVKEILTTGGYRGCHICIL